MKISLALVCICCLSIPLKAQHSINEIHDRIKENQLADEQFEWKHFGTLNYTVAGTQNAGEYRLNIEAGTTVRMYLLSKTDCIPYFDVRDPQTRYIFGSSDRGSLETEIEGFKAITAVYTYPKKGSMNIKFGVRWGCSTMLKTDLKLLIFYQKEPDR